jgi:monofunctional biosynthetic peptidoglycan transglycosylase
VIRGLLAWLGRLIAAGVVVSLAAVIAYQFVDPPLTPLMLVRMGEAMAEGRQVRVARQRVPLEAVSPALVRAVVVAEDARFLEHAGVDLEAARRALDYNTRHRGRRLRGAGTISMQCARNVFLWQGRSWLRKALEVYFAGLLELVWGKRRILEVYLNVVEWGDGLYGVEAAARRYFGVPAAGLDAAQAALLAAALPSPRRSNPAAPSAYLRSRAAIIQARAARTPLGPLSSRPKDQEVLIGEEVGLRGQRPAGRRHLLDHLLAGELVVELRTDGQRALVPVDHGRPPARLEGALEGAQVGEAIVDVVVGVDDEDEVRGARG